MGLIAAQFSCAMVGRSIVLVHERDISLKLTVCSHIHHSCRQRILADFDVTLESIRLKTWPCQGIPD